jgi:hypothetical protein
VRRIDDLRRHRDYHLLLPWRRHTHRFGFEFRVRHLRVNVRRHSDYHLLLPLGRFVKWLRVLQLNVI